MSLDRLGDVFSEALPTSFVACGIFSALTACSATVAVGRKFDTAHVEDIRPCVTTETDLLAWFGEPFRRGNENGLPTIQWGYAWARATVGKTESESQSQLLIVVLNRRGQVVHFQLNPVTYVTEVKDICRSDDDASTR